MIKIYHVPCDYGDIVCRLPIYSNRELYQILSFVYFPGKSENKKRLKGKKS